MPLFFSRFYLLWLFRWNLISLELLRFCPYTAAIGEIKCLVVLQMFFFFFQIFTTIMYIECSLFLNHFSIYFREFITENNHKRAKPTQRRNKKLSTFCDKSNLDTIWNQVDAWLFWLQNLGTICKPSSSRPFGLTEQTKQILNS